MLLPSVNERHLVDFFERCDALAHLGKCGSRRNVIPSSRATRLISEVGRRLMIISRIWSDRSSNSEMALRPRKPVPEHSRQPTPSTNSTWPQISGSRPEALNISREYRTFFLQCTHTTRTSLCARMQFNAETKL